MMSFLLYIGKAAVATAVFYLFYRLLLRKETFHRLSRAVLVGTCLVSFLLPLCIVTIHKPVQGNAALQAMMDTFSTQLQVASAGTPWWQTALVILYWTGVAAMLARTAFSVASILRIIRRATPVQDHVYVTEEEISPFSWMDRIVLSRADWEAPHDSILAHERAHIAKKHSIELLLVDVMIAFQWFNPAIWMLRADLQELHEYEADEAVLQGGANLSEYQYLLVRKAFSDAGYSVANSFSHSTLKNRLRMMSRTPSASAHGLKALYVLPLVLLAVGVQANTVYDRNKDYEGYVTDTLKARITDTVGVIQLKVVGKVEEDPLYVIDGKMTEDAGALESHSVYQIKRATVYNKEESRERFGVPRRVVEVETYQRKPLPDKQTLVLIVTGDGKVEGPGGVAEIKGYGKHLRKVTGNMVLPLVTVQIKADASTRHEVVEALMEELKNVNLL